MEAAIPKRENIRSLPRRVNLLTATLALSGMGILQGCAIPAPAGVERVSSQLYACKPIGGPNRLVKLRVLPQARAVRLDLGAGKLDTLQMVADGSGELYADAAHAWRAGPGDPVLTDIEAIQTSRCTLAATGTAQEPPA